MQEVYSGGPILSPAGMLPLLGAAYSRAREYTFDNYGFACCSNPHDAVTGLAALSAGGKRYKTMSVAEYAKQAAESGGFWMSFHELTADYPWLVKRMANIAAKAKVAQVEAPKRHPLAWLLALAVPRTGAGSGGGASILISMAVIGIIAAIAIPNFIAYKQRMEAQQSGQEKLLEQSSPLTHRPNDLIRRSAPPRWRP